MNRVSGIFSQMLQLVPRLEFEAAVRQHQAERHARGFRPWQLFETVFHRFYERCRPKVAGHGGGSSASGTSGKARTRR